MWRQGDRSNFALNHNFVKMHADKVVIVVLKKKK